MRLGQPKDTFVAMLPGPGDTPVVIYNSPTAEVIQTQRSASGTWHSFSFTDFWSVTGAAIDPDGTTYILGYRTPLRSSSTSLSLAWFDGQAGAVNNLKYIDPSLAHESIASRGFLVAVATVQRADPMNQWVNGGLLADADAGRSLRSLGTVYGDGSASSRMGDRLHGTSIAIGPDDRWNVAFIHDDELRLGTKDVEKTSWPVVATRGDLGGVRLKIAADGTPHVVYSEVTGHAFRAGSTWTDEVLAQTTGVGSPFAFELDESGRPGVAWSDGAKLKLARFAP